MESIDRAIFESADRPREEQAEGKPGIGALAGGDTNCLKQKKEKTCEESTREKENKLEV